MSTNHYDNFAKAETNSVPKNGNQSEREFTEIPLQIGKQKKPKRILHFSDGVLEEYSSEEEMELDSAANSQLKVANTEMTTKDMTWSVYLWYLALTLGSKTLSVCDYLGENLAHFFGITTPKYQYEIDEYQRIIQEEEELKREEKEQSAGWVSSLDSNGVILDDLPVLSSVQFGQPTSFVKSDLRGGSTTVERY